MLHLGVRVLRMHSGWIGPSDYTRSRARGTGSLRPGSRNVRSVVEIEQRLDVKSDVLISSVDHFAILSLTVF